jgi:hypothetical protein
MEIVAWALACSALQVALSARMDLEGSGIPSFAPLGLSIVCGRLSRSAKVGLLAAVILQGGYWILYLLNGELNLFYTYNVRPLSLITRFWPVFPSEAYNGLFCVGGAFDLAFINTGCAISAGFMARAYFCPEAGKIVGTTFRAGIVFGICLALGLALPLPAGDIAVRQVSVAEGAMLSLTICGLLLPYPVYYLLLFDDLRMEQAH